MTTVRAHLLVGGEVSKISTTRRGAAAAGKIPVLTMPKPPGLPGGAFSQGRRPAESRHACVPIRVLQNGGQPIHTAPTRRENRQGVPRHNSWATSTPAGGDQEPRRGSSSIVRAQLTGLSRLPLRAASGPPCKTSRLHRGDTATT